MKRLWIALALVASVLALVAAGCGSGDDEAAPVAPAPAEPAPAEPAPAEPAPAEPAPAEPAPAEPAPAEGTSQYGADVPTNGTYGEDYDPNPDTVAHALIKVEGLPDDPDARNALLATFARAETDVDIQKAFDCWKANGCDTGTGGEVIAGMADGFGGNVWRQVTKMEFILQALSYPEIGKIIYTDANLDTQKAISDFRSLIAQGVDVMIGYADAGDALLPSIKEATKRGIPYVTYANGPVGEPGVDYTAVTGPDNCTFGQAFAEAVAAAYPDGGVVAHLGGTPGNPISTTINDCEVAALEEIAPGKFENLPLADTNWTRQGSLEAASGILSAHGTDVVAWSGECADCDVGILRAYDAAGLPYAFLLGAQSDEQSLMCPALESPELSVHHASGYNSQGRMALTIGMMKLAGAPIPGQVVIKAQLKKADDASCVPEIPLEGSPTSLVPVDLYQMMFAK